MLLVEVVLVDLIGNHFEDKEVSDVGMIETIAEDNKLLKNIY